MTGGAGFANDGYKRNKSNLGKLSHGKVSSNKKYKEKSNEPIIFKEATKKQKLKFRKRLSDERTRTRILQSIVGAIFIIITILICIWLFK